MPNLFAVLIFALGFFAVAPSVFGGDPLPSAKQIIEKAIAQSRQSEKNLATAGYSFTKVTEMERFDDEGRIKERKKSQHEMACKSGYLSKKRLVGPGETVAEAKKIEEQENKNLAKLAGKYKGSSRGDYLNILTLELIGKYSFTLVKCIDLNGRPTFELAFKPKQKNLPGKELVERVLNQATGKIWIDAEEFEVAKARVHVDSEITVGGGLLGCLKKAVFVIERVRLSDGIWFDHSTKTDYEARKLTESMRVVTKSESRNFQVQPKG